MNINSLLKKQRVNKDKSEREQRAADKIYTILPDDIGKNLRALWEEFEEGVTAEAKFANAMDRLQPVINNIYNNGGTWLEYKVSWESFLKRMEPIKNFNDEIYNYVIENAKKYF